LNALAAWMEPGGRDATGACDEDHGKPFREQTPSLGRLGYENLRR
jgi:hypothetical protein